MRLFLFLLLLLPIFADAGTRRARYLTLKPRALSASLAFDSRAITGITPDALIVTWADRSGNSRNLISTQSSERPTYRIRQQAGQAVVRFDATDGMQGTWSELLTSETVILALQSSSPGTFARFFTQTDAVADYNSPNNYIPFLQDSGGNNLKGFLVGGSFFSTITNAGAWMVVTAVHTGSAATNYRNGVPGSTATTALSKSITRFAVGVTNLADRVAATENVAGDYGGIFVFNRSLSDPLRRRIEQALALSFKIPQ